jgi:hypothetical protein
MGKKTMIVLAAVLATGAAQAAGKDLVQENDCKLVQSQEISQVVDQVRKQTGLQLAGDQALRVEVHCMPDGASKRFVYAIRAAVEKSVSDGEQMRWTVLAQTTGYGTTGGSTALLRQVGFTVTDVIRQEP